LNFLKHERHLSITEKKVKRHQNQPESFDPSFLNFESSKWAFFSSLPFPIETKLLHSPDFLIGQPRGDGEAHPLFVLATSPELLPELELLLSLESVSNSDPSFLFFSNPPPPQLFFAIVSILNKKGEFNFSKPKSSIPCRIHQNHNSTS
jgi:hypothetical protein